MPTSTYTPLANITLGSAAASVTFSSIVGTYKDLVLVSATFQNNAGDQASLVRFNSDTADNYSWIFMDTYGGNPSSGSGGPTSYALYEYHQNVSSTTPSLTTMNIMDYSVTNKHKTSLHRFGAGSATTGAYATRWASTSVITSVTVASVVGSNFQAGSSFALYGIAS